ncbi:MAG: 2-oxoacid:acceptor oxidoreductase family protein [Oscillospiraceae bacterium]
MADLIFAGFGGQGVLTAGLIVAKTAMDFGDNVTWIPSYGSEMRGGTANSPEKISSPFIREIDVLIAMNIPSVAKFMPMMRAGATLVVNSTMVPEDYAFRKDIKVYSVPATAIAHDCENDKGGNIVMLGGLAFSEAMYKKNVIENGIDEFFLSKGKNNPKNKLVFEEGFKSCKLL